MQQDAPATRHRRSVRARVGAEIVGFSETTFWLRHKNDPTFPSAYKVGPRTTLWYADELVEWRDRHRAVKQAPGKQETVGLVDQLRAVMGNRAVVAELAPGSGAFLVTLNPEQVRGAAS